MGVTFIVLLIITSAAIGGYLAIQGNTSSSTSQEQQKVFDLNLDEIYKKIYNSSVKKEKMINFEDFRKLNKEQKSREIAKIQVNQESFPDNYDRALIIKINNIFKNLQDGKLDKIKKEAVQKLSNNLTNPGTKSHWKEKIRIYKAFYQQAADPKNLVFWGNIETITDISKLDLEIAKLTKQLDDFYKIYLKKVIDLLKNGAVVTDEIIASIKKTINLINKPGTRKDVWDLKIKIYQKYLELVNDPDTPVLLEHSKKTLDDSELYKKLQSIKPKLTKFQEFVLDKTLSLLRNTTIEPRIVKQVNDILKNPMDAFKELFIESRLHIYQLFSGEARNDFKKLNDKKFKKLQKFPERDHYIELNQLMQSIKSAGYARSAVLDKAIGKMITTLKGMENAKKLSNSQINFLNNIKQECIKEIGVQTREKMYSLIMKKGLTTGLPSQIEFSKKSKTEQFATLESVKNHIGKHSNDAWSKKKQKDYSEVIENYKAEEEKHKLNTSLDKGTLLAAIDEILTYLERDLVADET